MIKFVQVTYPFLLVWAAFTHRKIANFEESLSQVDKNEHLFTNIQQKCDRSNQEDLAKESENVVHEDINHSDADADEEANISSEGNVSKKKYSSAKEPFYHVSHREQRKRNVNATDFNEKRTDLSHERKLHNNNNKNKSYNTTTTCVLLNDSDSIDDAQYESDNSITTFDFTLDLMTDDWPEETSWKLQPQNSNVAIIDSREENATSSELVNNTLHEFEYHCVVSGEELNEAKDIQLENICYNFELHDSADDGICCRSGSGYFSLSLNNSTTPMIVDTFYSSSLISPFCLDNKKTSESKLDTSSKYPARECMNKPCICDSKPRLSNIRDDDVMFNTKVLTLNEIMMISNSKVLANYESPQYKAACWVLHDDPFYYDDSFEIENTQERMMQRYILALFYFATKPEKWNDHLHFLSSKSECDWNDDYDRGIIICNEDSNVLVISLDENDLEGTIVDELSELRTLEVLNLNLNNIRGTVPSVLGRLSELRNLELKWNYLEGSIPPELFYTTKLEVLWLWNNRLEGTIPETIGNLQKLSRLHLGENNLSGSIPDALYSLKNLKELILYDNKLSSSISPLIGNLNRLGRLQLENNMLTGKIPSTIGSLSLLWELWLENNRLSGSIPSTVGNMTSLERLRLNNNTLTGPLPESLFDPSYLGILLLQDNSVTGSVPNESCKISDGYGNVLPIEADCRNDVFDPEVSCSCCVCKNESPIWDGKCADTTVKVEIDHGNWNSNGLEWSLTNDATGKNILYDGPYRVKEGIQTFKACTAYSDCFSFNQISPPSGNTNYTIYWNNNSIHNGTFLGWDDNNNINRDDPLQTLLTFSYNEENQRLPSCDEIEFTCGEEEQPITMKPNTTNRFIYYQATKRSGKTVIHDTSSPQSKALCWILNNNLYASKADISDTDIIQRYVLAILHIMSPDGLLRKYEYPPNTNECDWNGITCEDNNTNIVTEISLSNQVINGTIIEELGSLKYLKALDLSQTQLHGSIPRSFANLWSLKELNLSGNEISGTMPATMFHELNKLEHIDLSHNLLSGSINKDIGSYSHIRTLLLRDNLLTGSIPLDGFNYYDLEHLDISENELSVLDFSVLLKQKKLNVFDISSNFLVGSLHEDTFTSLTQLQYLNISQNDIYGTIPTTFPKLSNITHFDVHANKLRGTIPLGITEFQSINHLNLQGNKLTGSLPSELNKLKSLNTLALSHNELKGSIPFEQKNLQNLKRLHLQNNKLEGEAPQFSNMIYYITDCGFPSDSLDKVKCSTCNTCCNSDGGCQSKGSKEISQKKKSKAGML